MANLVLKNNTSGGKTSVTADNFVGNASTASKWLTARTLTLSGDVSGSASFDGSGNISLTTVVADSSHNHAASNITSGTISIDRLPTITIAKGGTGATTAAAARTNLGVPSTTGSGASGTWGINISGTSAKLAYPALLETDAAIDAFNEANCFKVGIWSGSSSPGFGNGILLNMGWTSTTYGAQLAIDDDPTYNIMLRQRNGNGWNAWKRIPMGDGTGASGTWGISISGNAATATAASNTANVAIRRTITGSNHAEALKAEFNSYKASIPRNTLSTYYSTAYGNGSFYMGYFLSGYDTAPYGGFFAAHYDAPYYIGISNGSYNQQNILTSSNYSSWCAPASHTHSYVPLSGGTMTGKLQVNHTIFSYQYTNSNNRAAFMWDKPGSNYTGVGACGQTDMIHFGPCDANANWVASYNQIWRFQGGVYATGWLETDNYGTSAPGSSTPGYGRGGAIYFKV